MVDLAVDGRRRRRRCHPGVGNTLGNDPSGPGTALRQPVIAWLCVAAVLAMCIVATVAVRTAPWRVMSGRFAAAEFVLAIALSAVDGWVFDPGHVFETSQSLATQYPLIAMATARLAFGPWVAARHLGDHRHDHVRR